MGNCYGGVATCPFQPPSNPSCYPPPLSATCTCSPAAATPFSHIPATCIAFCLPQDLYPKQLPKSPLWACWPFVPSPSQWPCVGTFACFCARNVENIGWEHELLYHLHITKMEQAGANCCQQWLLSLLCSRISHKALRVEMGEREVSGCDGKDYELYSRHLVNRELVTLVQSHSIDGGDKIPPCFETPLANKHWGVIFCKNAKPLEKTLLYICE